MATNRLLPAKPIHPGSILKDELAYRNIKQKDFAAAIGMKPSNFNEIIKGKRPISAETAMKIGQQLGSSGSVWLNLQHSYEEDLIRVAERDKAEQHAIERENIWKELFDLNTLYKRLNISSAFIQQRTKRLIEFITDCPENIQFCGGCYKRTAGTIAEKEREKGIRTWQLIILAKAKQETLSQHYQQGNENHAANRIASLARSGTATLAQIRNILESNGIIFIEEPNFTHCPVDAFSTFIGSHPLIAVTKRYNNMDKLTFDILHELGHIHLHLQNDTTKSFIELDQDYSRDNQEEKEANTYAADKLITPSEWKRILRPSQQLNSISHYKLIEVVAKNASLEGISPSIAVARYKQEKQFYNCKRFDSPKIT